MSQLLNKTSTIPTYLINLDRATERLVRMESILSELSMAFERVPAVDGTSLAYPLSGFDEPAFTLLHGRRRNPGEIGCYLSHIECARRLLASNAQHALILEDDLSLPVDMQEIISAAIVAKADWDILRLSSVNSGKKFSFRKLTADHSLAISLTREKGSGAYVINRKAARWFVEQLMPMRLPFDLAFDLEYLSGLKAAFVSPLPVDQETGQESQIQGRRRSFHLSRWHYATVLPYRSWLEVSRFLLRSTRLAKLTITKAVLQSIAITLNRLRESNRYLEDMAVLPDQAPTRRSRKSPRSS